MLIFSAVGKKTTDKKGRFIVEAAGEEYYLVNMEVYVWAALLWNFVERESGEPCVKFNGTNWKARGGGRTGENGKKQ